MSDSLWSAVFAVWLIGAGVVLLTIAARSVVWVARQVGYWRLGRHLQRAMRDAQPGEAFLLAPEDAEVRIVSKRRDARRDRAPWN